MTKIIDKRSLLVTEDKKQPEIVDKRLLLVTRVKKQPE